MGKIHMIKFLLFPIFLFSQNFDKCFDYVLAEKMLEAKQEFLLQKNDFSEKYQFLVAIFEANAKIAVQTFSNLYYNSQDDFLIKLSGKKLYEYYFAIGSYQRAKLFESYNDLPVKKVTEENVTFMENFTVQAGAFAVETYALALKQKINKTMKVDVFIKREFRNGNFVYKVNIGKFSKKSEAEIILKKIQREFNLKGLIREI
jgi:ABC-type antimicrobial peptide transport system permease subunit